MGNYNEDSIYVGETDAQLEERLLNAFNLFLVALKLPTVSLEAFRTSNMKLVNNTNLEFTVQIENLITGLQSNVVSILQNKQKDLLVTPYGSTVQGIKNAIATATGYTEGNVYGVNSTVHKQAKGEVLIVMNDGVAEDKTTWQILHNSLSAGDKTIGTGVVLVYQDEDGDSWTYSWDKIETKALKVRLYYKYSSQYLGDVLDSEEITNNYVQAFNDTVQVGEVIEPEIINSKINTAEVFQNIETEFSIDDGATWGVRNAILEQGSTERYTVAGSDVEVMEE